MASARITVERSVVRFGLDYACAHIIILAENSGVNVLPEVLPIRADFVTERGILCHILTTLPGSTKK